MLTTREARLSRQEIEILQLVARGLNNKAIAREHLNSESAVKAHMLHTFGKLYVTDRTAAVTPALRRGIIRLDP